MLINDMVLTASSRLNCYSECSRRINASEWLAAERCEQWSDMANHDHLLAIMVWQFFDLERSLLDALQERPDELAAA